MKKILLVAVVGYLFSACEVLQLYPEDPIKGAGVITLKFVQINDVYEIAPLNGGEYGGLARVAYIRDSIKEKFPNTFMFLAGDFLNPSLIGSLKVDEERVNGKQMIDVLNAMNIDLVTFGNHEFDLNEKDLQKRLNESNFNWTTANVRHVTEKGLLPFTTKWEYSTVPTSDFATFNAMDADGNKIKFGVFGVTLPSNPKEYVSYGDIYENAERAYNLAIQKADFVVGLTHVSIEEDREIARRIRSLPLIMGGHEHFNMLEKEGRTIITKADANAKSIYIHTLIYNLRTKHLYINSELMMVTNKIPSSAKVERVVTKWTDIVDEKLKEIVENPQEIIYYAGTPLDGTDTANRSKQTNMGGIITGAMAYAYANKVDGAIVNGGSIRLDDKLEGDISSIDIFRVLPFGGSVLKTDFKGSLLKEILDYGNSKTGEGAYLQRYNISRNEKNEWEVNGKAINDNKTYTIAISDFLLKGLDIPFLLPDNKGIIKTYYPQETESAADIRKAIIMYLKSQKK